PLCESRALVSEFVEAEVPVVAIASGRFHQDISCVRIDDFRASKDITLHLVDAGHRRIGYLNGNPNQTASLPRFEGFQSALAQAGIELDESLVEGGFFTYRSGLDAAEKLLANRQPPTAICAANDDMAAAAVSVAHRRGLDVPRDLSIVGFDDTSAASTVWPELTTIHQPIAEMADSAVDILLRNIRRKDKSTRTVIDRLVPHELIERD